MYTSMQRVFNALIVHVSFNPEKNLELQVQGSAALLPLSTFANVPVWRKISHMVLAEFHEQANVSHSVVEKEMIFIIYLCGRNDIILGVL